MVFDGVTDNIIVYNSGLTSSLGPFSPTTLFQYMQSLNALIRQFHCCLRVDRNSLHIPYGPYTAVRQPGEDVGPLDGLELVAWFVAWTSFLLMTFNCAGKCRALHCSIIISPASFYLSKTIVSFFCAINRSPKTLLCPTIMLDWGQAVVA